MRIKTYSMSSMNDRDVINMFNVFSTLGFGPMDFRVVHFGSHMTELKVMSKELNWLIKSIVKLKRIKGI